MSIATGGGTGRVLQPDPAADELARHMVNGAGAEEVQRAIVRETVESAENGRLLEAGRTACGSMGDVRRPYARFPRAVELAECPRVNASGFWHTHPGEGELRSPRHSLPDWGNVVFGITDVSVVSGTQDAQVVVAADDREAMLEAFQSAVGHDVSGKRDVMNHLVSGRIDHDATIDRVEAELAPLVRRVPTGYPDLEGRFERARGQPATAHAHPATAHCHEVRQTVSPDIGNLRARSRAATDGVAMIARKVAATGFDEAIGVVAGTVVSNYLFGR